MGSVEKELLIGVFGIVTTVVGLFGWLLKYVMSENSKREANYNEVISRLSGLLNGEMKGLKEEVGKLVVEVRGGRQ